MLKEDERLNTILVTVDSLRVDVLGCFGRGNQSTPNLEEFANQGVMFSQAIAQGPYTTTSIPSLLTGLYPIRLKPIPSSKIAGVLPEEVPTIAKLLKRNGYHTAAFHSNPLLSRVFGYDSGFDIFYDDLVSGKLRLPRWVKLLINRVQRAIRLHPYLPAPGINRLALKWLKKVKPPFFLWLHYMDPHGPYQSKRGIAYINKIRSEQLWHKAVKRPETLTEQELAELKASYQEEVAYLVRHLGDLFEELMRMDLLENSLVILTSDHGDAFGEHGFFTHPHELYDELIHVPLIIYTPKAKPQTIDRPVGLVNLTPTVLDYAGVNVEAGSFDGLSLRPLLEHGKLEGFTDYVISEAEFDPYIGAVRTTEWKFILNERKGTKELYHIKKDPGEQRNVIHEYPRVAQELEAILQEHLASAPKMRAETAARKP